MKEIEILDQTNHDNYIYRIRKMCKSDIDKCIKIVHENFNQINYQYDITNKLLHSDKSNEYYVCEVGLESDMIFDVKAVAGLGHTTIGMTIFSLHSCYVDVNFQRKKIGNFLTNFRINRIKELGGKIIFSVTREKKHLEHFGFTIENPQLSKGWDLMKLQMFN